MIGMDTVTAHNVSVFLTDPMSRVGAMISVILLLNRHLRGRPGYFHTSVGLNQLSSVTVRMVTLMLSGSR